MTRSGYASRYQINKSIRVYPYKKTCAVAQTELHYTHGDNKDATAPAAPGVQKMEQIMATRTFTLGSTVKYEAVERIRYNGVDGVIWVKRIKCADGSGWMHDGKTHLPLRATRREVVEHFGQVYRPELINAQA